LLKQKKVFLVSAIVVLLLTVFATTVVHAQNDIPSSIVEKSNQFIISKVGQDFFDKYIKMDYNQSKYYPPDEYYLQHPEGHAKYLENPYYFMVYSFKMPEKPFVDEFIEFAVDTEGNVILESEPYGIPDPAKCDFIDEATAIQIAKNVGLEEGIAAWETSFHWYAYDLQNYVWAVQNTLPIPSGQDYIAYGKGIVIDANSGEVLQNYEYAPVASGDGTTSTTSYVPITLLYIAVAIVIAIVVFTVWRIVKRKK
jgi:hypothetical protein